MAKTISTKEQTRTIPLGKNKFLRSNGLCYWIAQGRKSKGKDGEVKTSYTRVSGYHADFNHLIDSYIDHALLSAEIESLTEFGEEIRKLKREVKGWIKKMEESR